MEPLVTEEEMARIEELPLEERAAAIESIERRLRTSLDDLDPA